MGDVFDKIVVENQRQLAGVLDQVLATNGERCAELSKQHTEVHKEALDATAERCNQSMQDFTDTFLAKLQTVHQRIVTIENLDCANEMRALRDRISQLEANDVDQILDALAPPDPDPV